MSAFILLAGAAVGARAEETPDNDTCLGCHADEDLAAVTPRGKQLKLVVGEKPLAGSVHEDASCTDCHQGAKQWEDAPHNGGQPLRLACFSCHEEEKEQFDNNCVHGRARREGNLAAPDCHDCHGGHDMKPLSSPESRLDAKNQVQTCGRCHGSDELADGEHIAKRRLVERYQTSVHWLAIKEGKPAASCTDCHGAHSILPSSEVKSHVSRVGLLASCAKCHPAEVQQYSAGSHGRTLLNGNLDVPNCVTCHGDHDIVSLRMGPGGRRSYAATQICIWCHGNERMMRRYALDTSPVESYMRDFHGLTQRGSQGASATCADCHDAHRSLPSSHPQSRMHITNRGTACGKCHGKSSDSFILSFSHRHVTPDRGKPVKDIVLAIYIVLMIVVLGGMLLHNLLVWFWAVRRKMAYQRARAGLVRMNRFECAWHWLLLLSFSGLVVTGFALKYSDSVVFSWLYSLGLSEQVRAVSHRLFALMLLASLVMLVIYPLANRRGRIWWRAMLPRASDVKLLFATMSYYLGRRRERPRQEMFGYAEKAEFWALVWGTVIMALTGFVLWFPKSLPGDWPGWVIDVARLIHFLEAVLATLAIVIWHLFNTIFHPHEYPMDTSWLTGVLSREEAEHRFTEEAIALQQPEPPAAPPPPPEKPAWMEEEAAGSPETAGEDAAGEEKSGEN